MSFLLQPLQVVLGVLSECSGPPTFGGTPAWSLHPTLCPCWPTWNGQFTIRFQSNPMVLVEFGRQPVR